MTCQLEEIEDSTTCRIRLSGNLNVSNALTLHQAVVTTCEKYPQVDLLLHDVTAFDVASMQILLAAVNDTSTRVTVQIGENADSVTHWLSIAGIGDDVLKFIA